MFSELKSGHLYIDPLETLKHAPKAADMIGRATKNMNDKTLQYRGINQKCQENIVKYCDQVSRTIKS